jgi:hypothetical protein
MKSYLAIWITPKYNMRCAIYTQTSRRKAIARLKAQMKRYNAQHGYIAVTTGVIGNDTKKGIAR